MLLAASCCCHQKSLPKFYSAFIYCIYLNVCVVRTPKHHLPNISVCAANIKLSGVKKWVNALNNFSALFSQMFFLAWLKLMRIYWIIIMMMMMLVVCTISHKAQTMPLRAFICRGKRNVFDYCKANVSLLF